MAKKPAAPIVLNDKERMILAKAVHKARKADPSLPWKKTFDIAMKALPEGRRLRDGVDHPNKVSWIKPMLEDLSGTPSTAKKAIILSEKEKESFANAVYEAVKANPQRGYASAIREANKLMPEGRKVGDSISAVHHLSWLGPMLMQIETKNGAKLKTSLTDDEKLYFAEAFVECLKANPEGGNMGAIREANKLMPEGRQIGAKIDSIKQIPWIIPLLAEIEARDTSKARVILDDAERVLMAKAVFEYQNKNPGCTQEAAIQAAIKTMPANRRLSSTRDSFVQIPWIIPLLAKLNNKPEPIPELDSDVAGAGKTWLTDKEKEDFTKTVYLLRKGNATWTRCMKEANAFLPEDRRLASSNPSGVPWLKRALEKMSLAETGRVVIDHRNTFPKAEEEPAPIPHKQKGAKKGSSRLALSDEDKEHFAELVYQFRLHHSGWGWQRILDEANMEMPAHKRREHMPPSPSQLPWLPPLLDKIGSRPPAPIQTLPEPVVEAPKVESPTIGMEDAMINMMANMMKQFMPALMQNPETQKKLQTAMMSSGAAPVQEQPKPFRRKVLVVGLLPIQTQETQRDFGRVFDFKFITSNTPSQQIKDASKNADIAIIMTQFVSHSTQAALRQHPGFEYCNGNSTALKMLLEEKVSGVKVGQ